MTTIDYSQFSANVREGLRSTITRLIESNPNRSFYTFAIWTDDSLQFAYVAANTEEGLSETVSRYNEEVDPKYDTTSTRNSMRWAYGDWEFFPVEDEEGLEGDDGFADVNAVLGENFNADEDVFEAQFEPLEQALLDGFVQLDKEGFFGTGETRSKITLLLVGHVDEDMADKWAVALNPKKVAQQYLEWDCDAPESE